MDDLISRQAAIEAVGYYSVHSGDKLLFADNALKKLPPAQPEQRWIPCSKRLPENRRYVLVTYQYEYGLIDHGITWYGEAEKKWDTSRNVIAWMPLPEPYAERGTDE